MKKKKVNPIKHAAWYRITIDNKGMEKVFKLPPAYLL